MARQTIPEQTLPKNIAVLTDYFRLLQEKFQNVDWYSFSLPLAPVILSQGPDSEVGILKEGQVIFFYCPAPSRYNPSTRTVMHYHRFFLKEGVLSLQKFLPDFFFRKSGDNIYDTLVINEEMMRGEYLREIVLNMTKHLKDFAKHVSIPQPQCFNEVTLSLPIFRIDLGGDDYNHQEIEWGRPLDKTETSWPNQIAKKALSELKEYIANVINEDNKDIDSRIASYFNQILKQGFGINGILDNHGNTLMTLESTAHTRFQSALLEKGAFISGVKLGVQYNHIIKALFYDCNLQLARLLIDASVRNKKIKEDVFLVALVLAITFGKENSLFQDQDQIFFLKKNFSMFSGLLNREEKFKQDVVKIFIKIIEADLEILNCRYEKFHNTSILGLALQNGNYDLVDAIGSILSNPAITAEYPNFKLTGVDELGNSDYFYLIASGITEAGLHQFEQFTADEHKSRDKILDKDGRNPLYYLPYSKFFRSSERERHEIMERVIWNCCGEEPSEDEFRGILAEFIGAIKGNENLLDHAVWKEMFRYANDLIIISEKRGVDIGFSDRFLNKKDAVGNRPIHKLVQAAGPSSSAEEDRISKNNEIYALLKYMLETKYNKQQPDKSRRKVEPNGDEEKQGQPEQPERDLIPILPRTAATIPATTIQTEQREEQRGTKRSSSPLAGVESEGHQRE